MWQGNRFADATAKSFALRLWEGRHRRAQAMAHRVDGFVSSMARSGICTRIAQVTLDSLKLPRVSRRRGKHGAAAGHCGDHDLVPRDAGGGHWCTRCRLITRTAASRRSLAAKPCKGEVLLGVHRTHHLRSSVGVTWCEKCGYYMSRLPRALRQPCSGAPRSAAARNVLRRLRSGLPPTTAAYLGRMAADDDWAEGWAAAFEGGRLVPCSRERPGGASTNTSAHTARSAVDQFRSAPSSECAPGTVGGAEADDRSAEDRQPMGGPPAVRPGGTSGGAATATADERGTRAILHRDERGAAPAVSRGPSCPAPSCSSS